MQRLALTVSECTEVARLGRTKIYQEIKEGRLRAVKLGRSTRILVEDLKHYLAHLPALKNAPNPDTSPKKSTTGQAASRGSNPTLRATAARRRSRSSEP